MATNIIFGMFARSPLSPLQEHMVEVDRCAQLLSNFVNHTQAQAWKEAHHVHEKIIEHEKLADIKKKDLRTHLPKELLLPVPRSDLLGLLTVQDTIANTAKDIAGLMIGRKMIIPDVLAPAFMNHLKYALQASEQATLIIRELDDLLEAGFKGMEVNLVNEMIEKLDEIEHKSDLQQIGLRQTLFKLEKSMPPVDVIFLYKIIDYIGKLANHAQQVGSRLQLLLAK